MLGRHQTPLLGLVLPSTAPRGAAGPGQSQGKELHGSSPDLPWGVSGRGSVSLQVVPGGFPCTGTGRSRQLPKALGVGQSPQGGLAAPVPPGILASLLPLKIQEDPPQLPLPQQWVTGFTGFNILQLLN